MAGVFFRTGRGRELTQPCILGWGLEALWNAFRGRKSSFRTEKENGCSLSRVLIGPPIPNHPGGGGWAGTHPSSLRHWRPAWRLTTDSPGGDPKGEQTLDGSRSRGLGVAFSCSSFFFSFAGSARSFRETSSALAWPRAGRENRVGGVTPIGKCGGRPPATIGRINHMYYTHIPYHMVCAYIIYVMYNIRIYTHTLYYIINDI